MKKSFLRCIGAAAAAVLLLLPLASYAGDTDAAPQAAASYAPWTQATDVPVTVCRSEGYSLLLCVDEQVLTVTDAAGEALWYGTVTPQTYSRFARSSKTWKNYMRSLLIVNYAAKSDTRGNQMKSYSAADTTEVEVFSRENGVRFMFRFTDISVSVAMEITLSGDRLRAYIPAEDIREDGEFVIRSLEVMPFFGAVAQESGADGYVVYPDGSGAISYFDRAEDKNAFTQAVALDVYDTRDLEKTLDSEKDATAMLPIFGIKNDSRAFLAAITAGSENATIHADTAIVRSAVPLYHGHFELFYRNEYRIYLSSVSGASADTTQADPYGVKLDTALQASDREVTYFLLQDDEADYSGMANAYRAYLLEEGLLNISPEAGENSLFLTLFMGIEKEDALLDPYVTMTDLQAAQDICRSLRQDSGASLSVLLRGWSKGGYGSYPQSTSPARALGGTKGLAALGRMAKEDPLLRVLLETELLQTGKERNIAVKGTSMAITDELETQFLLSPRRVEARLAEFLRAQEKTDGLSLALSSIGQRVYPDYHRSRLATRSDTVELWRALVENEKVTAVQGGALYVLGSAQRLYDMPAGCSLQQMTDRAIPWCYMILSGCLPYSTKAGNRTGDLTALKLQWVESGATPCFELTAESPAKLLDTSYNVLYSSGFSQWREQILAIVREMGERLSAVRGKQIVGHRFVGEEQVCVTYENGCRVVINHGDTPFTFAGQNIAARDYAVIE